MEGSYNFTTPAIWVFGYNGGGAYDPLTKATAWRHMNWDAVTSTNNGVVWGTNSYTLPDSLYLASKPAYFGALTWPPVDPANPVYSSSRTNIPAGYRFINGTNPPGAELGGPSLRSRLTGPTNVQIRGVLFE
jgi:hypothetical protein